MNEINENTIWVTDIDFAVMNKLFYYMYCVVVGNLDEIMGPLFKADDRYQIKSLKVICEKGLQKP